MLKLKKESYYPLVGLTASIFICLIVELILRFKYYIFSNALFIILVGSVIGFLFGLFFTLSIEKFRDLKDFFIKIVLTFLICSLGGGIALYLGSFLYAFISNYFYYFDESHKIIILTFTFVLSWGIIGFLLGVNESIKHYNYKRLWVSGFGGFIGGGLGAILSVIVTFFNNNFMSFSFITRFILFISLGLMIGYFIKYILNIFTSLELTFLNGKMLGKTYKVIDNDIYIGRERTNDLIVDEFEGVSRKHFKIIKENDNFFVKDNNSTNGVFVNDKKIDSFKLSDGDIVEFGKCKILISYKRENL